SRSPLLRNHDDGSRFHLIDKGLAMEISSSYIRQEFALGGEPRYLLPESCYQYILKHNLYHHNTPMTSSSQKRGSNHGSHTKKNYQRSRREINHRSSKRDSQTDRFPKEILT